MRLVSSVLKVPNLAASPAANWTSVGRSAAATTLVLSAALPLASHMMAQLMGPTDRTIDWLHWIVDHPDLANQTKTLDLLAVPFLFGTALVYVLLSRQRSPRLAYAGGIILGFGLVGLAAVEGYETLAVTLVHDGRFELSALAGPVDDFSSAPAVLMLLLLLIGGFLGLLTSAVALWRSRAVPRTAVLLIPAYVVVDFVLYEGLGIAPAWASHVISVAGASWIASAVLLAGRARSSGEALRQVPLVQQSRRPG